MIRMLVRSFLLMAIGLFWMVPGAQAQEQNEVTVTTYFPSPRGVYQELRSTGNTFLAMHHADSGGMVGIGTANPSALLSVAGSMAVGAGYADGSGPTVTLPPNSLGVRGEFGAGSYSDDPVLVDAGDQLVIGSTFAATSNFVRGIAVENSVGIGHQNPVNNSLYIATNSASAPSSPAIISLANNPELRINDSSGNEWHWTMYGFSGATLGPDFANRYLRLTTPAAVYPYSGLFFLPGGRVANYANVGNTVAFELSSYGGYFAGALFHNPGYMGIGDWNGVSYSWPSPGKLLVDGNVLATGGFLCNQADVAERFPISAAQQRPLEPGDVVAVAKDTDQGIALSLTAYDTTVVGVISDSPGMVLGMDIQGESVALTGRVPTKVTDEGGPIRPGDLLVASSKPGFAMRSEPHQARVGAVLGKALEAHDTGDGSIMVKINVQ